MMDLRQQDVMAQHVLFANAQKAPVSLALAPPERSYRGQQPFCRDSTGWTPLTSDGFGSCFLDAFVGGFGACGIAFGASALLLLLRSELQKPLFRTWNFYARFVS